MSELSEKLRRLLETTIDNCDAEAMDEAADRIEELEALVSPDFIADVRKFQAEKESLEAQLASSRRDALLEAAKAVCPRCRQEIPLMFDAIISHENRNGTRLGCNAFAIHKLLEPKGDSCNKT